MYCLPVHHISNRRALAGGLIGGSLKNFISGVRFVREKPAVSQTLKDKIARGR